MLACSPSDFCQTSVGCVRRNSVGLPLAMSIRIPSVLVILVAGLLSVHWQSIGKVRLTEMSAQKCSDQLRKLIGKILWWKSKKIWILLTLSPTESAWKSSGSVKTSGTGTVRGIEELGASFEWGVECKGGFDSFLLSLLCSILNDLSFQGDRSPHSTFFLPSTLEWWGFSGSNGVKDCGTCDWDSKLDGIGGVGWITSQLWPW